MNSKLVIKHITNWIKSYCFNNKIKCLVIGVSGGIDSALTSTLCAKTGLKTIIVSMPIHQNKKQLNLAEKHITWLKKKHSNIEVFNINLSEVFNLFKDTMPKELQNNFGECNIIHWSNAEVTHYNKINNRYGNIFPKLQWFDLMKFFKTNNIFILGALNFSLKTIAKKMYEYNMINTIWDDSDCMNGQDAMFKSWQMYTNNDINNSKYKDIIKYNEVDCKTMFEILNYLRDNH